MTSKVRTKVILIGMLMPIIFIILNYIVLRNPFNFAEVLMIITISIYSTYIYSKDSNYLDPRLYFPIFYFLIYYLGNFTFNMYQVVPKGVWWIYLEGLIGYYLGASISQTIVRVSTFKPRHDTLSPTSRAILFAIFLCGILTQTIMFAKNGIPLLVQNIDATRQSMSEDFGILKVISSTIPIIAIISFYDIVMMKKEKQSIPSLDCLIIVMAFGISILSVSRMLIIQMAFPMLIIYILKVKRIKIRTLLGIGLIIIIYIGVNQIMRNMRLDTNYMAAISQRGNNLFQNIIISSLNNFRVGVDDFYKLLLVVPSYSKYTYGKMFLNAIGSPLPGKQIVMGFYVMNLLGLSFNGIGAATTILGMFYLDGGIILIFLGMFLFGFIVQLFYKKYIYKNTVTIYSLVSIYILYYAINTIRTNVMPTIEPLLICFYYLMFALIIKMFRGKNK